MILCPRPLGAATGELVFSEIMLGQFGGLGELEKFITVTIGVYIAGRMVANPAKRKMVGIAAMTGVVIQQLLGTIVDILKVQFAVSDFEAVAGLPESVFATEGFAFLKRCAVFRNLILPAANSFPCTKALWQDRTAPWNAAEKQGDLSWRY